MELSSLSSSSPLSLHRFDFPPPLLPHNHRSASHRRRSYTPVSLNHAATTCSTSACSPTSSFFGIPLSSKPFKSNTLFLYSSRNRRSLRVVAGAFERFTERAIKAVMFSQREAKDLGEDMVFTQHLLLGLIKEDRAPAGFLDSGITIEMARDAVKSIWQDDGGGAKDGSSGEVAEDEPSSSATSATGVPFSASAKLIFEAAVEYSKTMGYNFIAPEHIAIGLLTVDDGNAERVLKRLGANVNYLAATAVSRLQGELAKDGRDPPASKEMGEKSLLGKTTDVRSVEETKEKGALDRFCVDLTAKASDGLIDPVIGRTTEVQRIIEILCRKTKNNPILLGQAGVGKTAIAEGLATGITEGNVPDSILTKRVMSLDIGLLISGAKERGELEGRVTALIKEIKESGNVILFIDEVHTLVGSGTVGRGNKSSGLDMANLLKPSLGRGEIQCIASTTMDEYRMHFEKDKALARRFQPVLINEPSQEDAVRILLGLREKYESHHQCTYTLEAINAAVYLSARYISDRYLPDKAIDLMDEAGSKARMESFRRRKEKQTCVLSKSPNDYWQEIKDVQAMHERALARKWIGSIDVSKVEGASEQQELSPKSDEGASEQQELSPKSDDDEPTVVGAGEIAAVASLWSGIPLEQLTADERMLLVGLDEQLHKRVFGQDEAVDAISRAVKRSRVGLKDPDRPIATLLFCGPTGVGKTELTKALAACYFGSEAAMLRLDMSEYMERHTVSKLIGSPPGYVGYGEGGTLTEAIRKRPFTVVLLDEIEKAHPDIFNILLQIYEDGHLTDSQGRRVSFKNALIVMTSNVGSAAIAKGNGRRRSIVGSFFEDVISSDDSDDVPSSYAGLKSLVMENLKSYFRPELLNRIDEVVVFRPLEKNQMFDILNMMLQEVKTRLRSFGVSLEVSEAAMDLICEEGFNRSYGARPLRRALTLLVEDPLSESLLSGKIKPGDLAVVDLDDYGKTVVRNKSSLDIHLSDTSVL